VGKIVEGYAEVKKILSTLIASSFKEVLELGRASELPLLLDLGGSFRLKS
jgi:hypothetical protein